MPIHQRVLHRLEVLLDAACPPDLEIVPGPGVAMSETNYRIPDLVIVRAGSIAIADANVTRPPELAVEIASPSTARYDRNRKKAVYAEFGIPAYWIVVPDPGQPSLTAFGLTQAVAMPKSAAQSATEPFAAATPFPVEIVPAELVAGPWRRAAR